MRRCLAAIAALLLAPGCTPEPDPARPALWEITAPGGEKGWLFGTIHALERPANWQTPPVDAAIARSQTLVVELVEGQADHDPAAVFAELSRSKALPPLDQRVAPDLRDKLRQRLSQGGLKASDFDGVETWAAALTLARVGSDRPDPALGVDSALRAAWPDKPGKHGPVRELEGTRRQLGIFDALPETEQRDLLNAVLRDAGAGDDHLAEAWRSGDMAAIERETARGMLADAELRKALLTDRNRNWAGQIDAILRRREVPFVAVGAAHMAGPGGLPDLLQAKGYTIRRVQ